MEKYQKNRKRDKEIYKNFISNKSAVNGLASAYYRQNSGRNRILIFTSSLSVILIFMIFSMVSGKLDADSVRKTMEAGMTASAYLENGTEELEQQISNLPFVGGIGHYKKCGVLSVKEKNIGECVYVDDATFENMMRPAYGKVYGAYPKNNNEIMLSMSCLEELDIENPCIGMALKLELYWYGMEEYKESGVQEFILSGYYEAYEDAVSDIPIVYLAKDKLDSNRIALYPQRILIDIKTDYLSGNQAGELLYEKVKLTDDEQLFVAFDSPKYKAVENMLGGYGAAFLFAVFILLCQFLLLYNVLFISLEQLKREIALMNVIGVTNKQLRQIMDRIGGRIAVKAVCYGGGIGIVVVRVGVQSLIKRMYPIKGMEVKIMTFHPILLLMSILFTVLTLFCAVRISLRKFNRNSPIEILTGTKQKIKSVGFYNRVFGKRSKNIVFYMAWRNIFRSKGRYLLTLFSLSMGCCSALTGSMVLRGVDNRNEIDKLPDITIGLTKAVLYNYCHHEPVSVTEETILDYPLISEEFWQEAVSIAEREEKNIAQDAFGCFAHISDMELSSYYSLDEADRPSRDGAAFSPIYRSNDTLWDGTHAGYINLYGNLGIIQVLEEEEITKLEAYVQQNQNEVDMDKFKNNDGVLIIHQQALNIKQKEQAETTVGTPIYLYPVEVMYPGKYLYREKGCLINCGYLDSLADDFPDIVKNWKGQDVLYFFVSRKTFENLDVFPKQIFRFSLEGGRLGSADSRFRQLVQAENRKYKLKTGLDVDLLYLICKSDLLAEQKNYLDAGKIFSGIISASLIIIGVMNYFNTVITDILVRRQEFYILRCIGMTNKEMLRMLIAEGLFYWASVNLLLLTGGNMGLIMLRNLLQSKIDYFIYYYPFPLYVIMSLITLLICLVLPYFTFYRVMYNKTPRNQSKFSIYCF